jgi:polyisoprenoid-binding protein YceI
MMRLQVVLAVLSVGIAGFSHAADVYQIDASHTAVGFTVRHMVINNVRGGFKDFTGTVEYDPADLSQLTAKGVVKAASIDTGIAARDTHLRGEDFFNVAKYPDITFTSKRVEQKGGQSVLVGDFTMHGVTKELALPMTINGPVVDPMGKTRIGLEFATTINRQDYGIQWSQKLDSGGLVLADEVKIEIAAEAVKDQPAVVPKPAPAAAK